MAFGHSPFMKLSLGALSSIEYTEMFSPYLKVWHIHSFGNSIRILRPPVSL